MTKHAAFDLAKKRAKVTQRERFIVYEDDMETGGPYHVASEADLEAFWLGAPIVACVQPDGSADWN